MSKQVWVMMIKRWALGVTVVSVFGIIFDRFVNEPYERSGLLAGVYAVLIYAALCLIVGFTNIVVWLLYVWLFANSDMKASILNDLHSIKIPGPRPHHFKNFSYLSDLADDEEESPEDRVKAALFVGTYKGIMAGSFFKALVIQKALDDAVLRYSQEAPEITSSVRTDRS